MGFLCRRISAPPGRLLLLAASIMLNACSHRDDITTKQISFWISDAPFSADPLDYDAFIHHIAFSSVYAGLVTNYRTGQYTGVIAKEWEVSHDQKTWRFTLRENLRFDNGDPITTKAVIDSWHRMAHLMSGRGSRSGFFEKLEGFTSFEKTGRITGLEADEKHITLRLNEPMPQLLDTLSFGLYAVVHPSCYDKTTGRWLDPRHTVASGPYSVIKWDETSFVLKLRGDFPTGLLHPKPLAVVKMEWAPEQRRKADILSGNSREDLMAGGYSYHGETESRIAFIRCQSWTHPDSPLHDKAERKRLREAFYANLEGLGFKPTLSFFPLAIPSVKELPRDGQVKFSTARRAPATSKRAGGVVTPSTTVTACCSKIASRRLNAKVDPARAVPAGESARAPAPAAGGRSNSVRKRKRRCRSRSMRAQERRRRTRSSVTRSGHAASIPVTSRRSTVSTDR